MEEFDKKQEEVKTYMIDLLSILKNWKNIRLINVKLSVVSPDLGVEYLWDVAQVYNRILSGWKHVTGSTAQHERNN